MSDYCFPGFLKCKVQFEICLLLLKWQSKDTNRVICTVFTVLDVPLKSLNSFTDSLQSVSRKLGLLQQCLGIAPAPWLVGFYLLDYPFKPTVLFFRSQLHSFTFSFRLPLSHVPSNSTPFLPEHPFITSAVGGERVRRC